MQSLYEHAGGRDALHRFVDIFYSAVLADPVLQPLFGTGDPHHVERLTMFESETFGGPRDFTEQLGFRHIIDVHRGLRITPEQRERFIELYLGAADTAGLPDDPRFRASLRTHVEFGTEVAMQNSHALTEDDLHECREMPYWDWEPEPAP